MEFKEFLGQFRSDDLVFALKALDLPVSGNKPDRIGRIVDRHESGSDVKSLLNAFRPEDVRRAAKSLGFID